MVESAQSVPVPHRSFEPPASRRAVHTMLALALIARLLPFLSLVSRSAVTWIYGRGLETGFVAHALLSHQGFASPFGGHTGPTALLSPGYILLVTGIFALFGEASTASAAVILLAQIALGVLTTWLIMQLAERLAGGRTAVIAGVFFALWPPLLWVPTIFWDTSLTLCLVPALLLLAMKLSERPTRGLWLTFGALCGVAVLINLALCLTVLAVFSWAAWNAPDRRRNALLAAALALLIYAPWPLRNARALHAFVPLRTTVGLELWMGNRDGASGYLDEGVFPLYNHQELAEYVDRGEVAYMHAKTAAAMESIRRHSGAFAGLTARRIVRFWLGAGTRGGSLVYVAGAAITSLFGLAGLVSLFRRGDRRIAMLYGLPLLVFPLPYYITHAEFRYRLALDPLLTTLAALSVVLLLRTLQSRSGSRHASARTSENAVVHA